MTGRLGCREQLLQGVMATMLMAFGAVPMGDWNVVARRLANV